MVEAKRLTLPCLTINGKFTAKDVNGHYGRRLPGFLVNAISPAYDLSRHGCNMIFLSFLLLLYEFCIFVYMVFITFLAVALDWVPHW